MHANKPRCQYASIVSTIQNDKGTERFNRYHGAKLCVFDEGDAGATDRNHKTQLPLDRGLRPFCTTGDGEKHRPRNEGLHAKMNKCLFCPRNPIRRISVDPRRKSYELVLTSERGERTVSKIACMYTCR